jgi:hypothetical protein
MCSGIVFSSATLTNLKSICWMALFLVPLRKSHVSLLVLMKVLWSSKILFIATSARIEGRTDTCSLPTWCRMRKLGALASRVKGVKFTTWPWRQNHGRVDTEHGVKCVSSQKFRLNCFSFSVLSFALICSILWNLPATSAVEFDSSTK